MAPTVDSTYSRRRPNHFHQFGKVPVQVQEREKEGYSNVTLLGGNIFVIYCLFRRYFDWGEGQAKKTRQAQIEPNQREMLDILSQMPIEVFLASNFHICDNLDYSQRNLFSPPSFFGVNSSIKHLLLQLE